MAAGAERQMNLAALQQRDPYITSIVDTASQVALYCFNPKINEWVSFLDEQFQICCIPRNLLFTLLYGKVILAGKRHTIAVIFTTGRK